MEEQLQRKNTAGVQKSLRTIFGHKDLHSQAVGNQPWVNNLNLFFNRFDRTSSPPPALLPRQYTSPTPSSFPTALSSQPPPHCCPHHRHLLTDTLQHASRPLLQPAPHDTQSEEPVQRIRARNKVETASAPGSSIPAQTSCVENST